jgi:YVTN family beta-propeller protein
VTLRIHGRPRTTRFCIPVCLALLVAAGTTRAETRTKTYVAHRGANLVSVIDTDTGTVVRTIAVGAAPTRVAITRDGGRAYVSNGDADSITVIDTATDAVVATIAVGDNPSYLAVTPDGPRCTS